MKVTIKQVMLQHFKNHEHFAQTFGTLTTIRGMNGEGKSSIGEAISWVLFGLDMMGSKLDPTMKGKDSCFAAVLLDVDGKEILFNRELVKGTAKYYINDVPTKATAYDETVKSIASKDLFLSLFNPSYFPSMKWTEQREMLLSYVTAPANKEVFATLPELQRTALEAALKKNTLDEIEAKHRDNKNKKEKELIAAKARVETLEQQNTAEPQDLRLLTEELERQEAANKATREANHKLMNEVKAYNQKKNKLSMLLEAIEKIKQQAAKLKEQTECHACKQAITDEHKQTVKDGMNTEYKALVQQYKTLKAEFDALPEPGEIMQPEYDTHSLRQSIDTETKRQAAQDNIEAAKASVQDVQASLNESIFLLDAVKAFRAKEAELQAAKVQSLFTTLSIRLWTETKEGNKNPAFELEMNGKPYSKLSLGEKARAGLELIEVLAKQSGIDIPLFIDNRESLTSDVTRHHQTIEAYAVPNQTLEVTTQ